jgi:hypothetical protein
MNLKMPDNRQLEIFSDLLVTAEREFDAVVKYGSLVDDKAQKTSGLAGIFLAAAFGFTKPESLIALQTQYGNISLVLLYAALILFVGSVGLCLRGMWLGKVPVNGISVTAHEDVAGLIFGLTDDIDDPLMIVYKESQLGIWKSAINELFQANLEKTHLIHYAQRVLAAGILVAALNLALLGFAARKNAIPSNQENHMPEEKQKNSHSQSAEKPQARLGFMTVDGKFVDLDPTGNASPDERRRRVLATLVDPAFIDAQVAKLHRLY